MTVCRPTIWPPTHFSTRDPWLKIWPIPALVATIIVAVDQLAKYWALSAKALDNYQSIEVVPGIFYLVRVFNRGAAWGMFARHTWLLAALSLVVFVVIIIYYQAITAAWRERGVATTLLLGGVGGNLIDRLFRDAGVIDFLSFRYQRWEWPAFNVADTAICVGVGIVILSSVLRPDELGPAAQPPVDELGVRDNEP